MEGERDWNAGLPPFWPPTWSATPASWAREVGTLSRLTELRRETLEPLTAVASFIFRHPADRERLVMWARHAGLPD